MKLTNQFKKTGLLATIVTTILLVASCGFNQNPEDTKAVAEEHNEAKFINNSNEKDAQFLVNAAEINMEQIQLGQLAQQKGTAPQVKELGKMLEDAHTKSQNDLIALAKRKTITIPTEPTENALYAVKLLNDKTENNFDKAYADMMVNKHKDAVETFQNVSTENYDADIKKWATTSLTGMRKHLDSAIDCQKKCEKS